MGGGHMVGGGHMGVCGHMCAAATWGVAATCGGATGWRWPRGGAATINFRAPPRSLFGKRFPFLIIMGRKQLPGGGRETIKNGNFSLSTP